MPKSIHSGVLAPNPPSAHSLSIPRRFEEHYKRRGWLPGTHFNNSPVDTPIAFASFAIVARVGFVFPFSIIVIKLRPTFSARAISPCEIPFADLIRFKLRPSLADSLCIMHSICAGIFYNKGVV